MPRGSSPSLEVETLKEVKTNLEIASHLPIMYTTCSLCIVVIDWVNWLNRALKVSIQSTTGRSNLSDAEEVLRQYQNIRVSSPAMISQLQKGIEKHNGEDVSSHSKELVTKKTTLSWRTKLLVSLIALSGMPGGNVDTGEKWLGKASMLQSIRSTDVKGVTGGKGRYLRKSHGRQHNPTALRKEFCAPSGQQDVDTVRAIAQSQSIGGNTRNSSLQQEVQVPNQLQCAKLDKSMLRIIVDPSTYPFDPGGILNLQVHSKERRSDTDSMLSYEISVVLYSNLEDNVLFEDGGIVMNLVDVFAPVKHVRCKE